MKKSTCLWRKYIQEPEPPAVMSCKRVTLWILPRITLFSKLIRALNGHSARKTKQPTSFRGLWVQRDCSLTVLLGGGGASVGRVGC